MPLGFTAKDGTIPEPYSKTGLPKEIIHEKTGIEMVFVPTGEFMMGRPKGTDERFVRFFNEGPEHRVRITNPFYLGKHEMTQGEWKKVMADNPSGFRGSASLPVEMVSWNDCHEFCRRAGDGLRLPTEAEWEYACRAGSRGRYCFGDDDRNLGDYAWYNENSGGKTHKVGQKKPNAWGVHDMYGNVQEWCEDWYEENYSAKSPVNDPRGPIEGSDRVLRGGGGRDGWHACWSTDRYWELPETRNDGIGFRLAVDAR